MDIQKTRYKKKLFTHVESHASAVSLLESGEQRYIKAINNNNNEHAKFVSDVRETVCGTWASKDGGHFCVQPYNPTVHYS